MTPERRAAVLAIVGRDLRVVRRSRAVVVPMIVVPVLVLILPPMLLFLVAGSPEVLAADLQPLLVRVAGANVAALPSDPGTQAVVLLLVYVFAPMFLLVPTMAASVTAADSIVGERERGTLELLLHSPTTDRDLLLAKTAAPWAIAITVAWVSGACYALVANAVLGAYGAAPAFPNRVWAVLLLWVAPAVAGLALVAIVLVSARVKTFQEASQVAGIVVVPVVGMVVAQVAGLVLFDVVLLGVLGGVLWLLTLLLMRFAVSRFRRERLTADD